MQELSATQTAKNQKNSEYEQIIKQKLHRLEAQLFCFPRFNFDLYSQLNQFKFSQLTQLQLLKNMFNYQKYSIKTAQFQSKQILQGQCRVIKYSSLQNICMSIKYGIACGFLASMIKFKIAFDSKKDIFIILANRNKVCAIGKVKNVDFNKSFKYWKPFLSTQTNSFNHDISNSFVNFVGIINIEFYAVGISYQPLVESIKAGQIMSPCQSLKILKKLIDCQLQASTSQTYRIRQQYFIKADMIEYQNRILQLDLIRSGKVLEINQIYQNKANKMAIITKQYLSKLNQQNS